MIPLSVPVIKKQEHQYVKQCLSTGWVSSAGPFVKKFEETIAHRLGVNHGVACMNGTSALHIALILAGVKQDHEVIVPTITFIAPINTVRYVGAFPVFMDCDEYLNIDVQKVGDFLKNNTTIKNGRCINRSTGRVISAVIPVHVFGFPCQMQELMALAKQYHLKVIEDATESLGSYYITPRGKKIFTATRGDFGCLSFNGNKIITSGGGGMIITKSTKDAKRAAYLTQQAKSPKGEYVHPDVGYNYRMTNIQAAIGLAQVERLEQIIKIKRANWLRYQKDIQLIDGLSLLDAPAHTVSNYWFYAVKINRKVYKQDASTMVKNFRQAGIEVRPLWGLNHQQRPYRQCQHYHIQRSLEMYRSIINIPCSVNLTRDQQQCVIEVLKKYAK